MQRNIWSVALVAAVLLIASAAWAQEIYVIAGGGPPVGTKITSLPYIINDPGFYFLTGNLTYNSTTGNAITVNADDVTLDLMGFSLTGPGFTSGAQGIYMNKRTNVEVRNGTVWGFNHGVFATDPTDNAHRIINVRAPDNAAGIWLYGNNHLIKDCSASGNSGTGLSIVGSGLITDSEANNNTVGIEIDGPASVLGNTAFNNGSYNFRLGNLSSDSILVDANSAFGMNPNYYIWSGTIGVVITDNNSGKP
jgi:hypothetical protein